MGATAEAASRVKKTTQARRGLMPLSLAGNLPPARAQWSNRCDYPLLPLPACGEGVGVRGPLHKGGLARTEAAFPRSSDSWSGPPPPPLRGETAKEHPLPPTAG